MLAEMGFSYLFDYLLLGLAFVSRQIPFYSPLHVGISHTSLPRQAVFPGPWEEYIKAPSDSSHIRPAKIWHIEGSVALSEAVLNWREGGSSITLDPGGLVIFEFAENIAGR